MNLQNSSTRDLRFDDLAAIVGIYLGCFDFDARMAGIDKALLLNRFTETVYIQGKSFVKRIILGPSGAQFSSAIQNVSAECRQALPASSASETLD